MKTLVSLQFIIILLLTPFISRGGDEKFIDHSTGPLTIGTIVKVEDAKFQYMQINPNWADEFEHSAKNRVSLYLDRGCKQIFQEFNADVELEFSIYDESNNLTTFTDTLTITYKPQAGANSIDVDMMLFDDAHKIKVEVTDIYISCGGGPCSGYEDCLRVKTEIIVDRHYYLDYDNSAAPTLSAQFVSSNDFVEFTWNEVAGAEEYDLEWVFIDDYKDTVPSYMPIDSLEYDFRRNAVRVSTPFNSYRIPNIFEHGYLLYRIRGVGIHDISNKSRLEGEWSILTDSGMVTSYANKLAITAAHETDDINWNYIVNYAENGKRQEQIRYLDGTMKTRQSVGKSQSSDKSMVQETFYDHQGRPAVFVLPAPAESNVIEFHDGFNKDDSGNEYNASDFDLDANLLSGSDYDLSNSYGASKYYSTNNPNQEGQQAFVPNANQYPIARVEYTDDLSGKIKRQSGFGDDHKLNSNHETEYFYADPTQKELDKMFGTDVGYSSNYKKVVVKDPNGQMTASYLDQKGNVIATVLGGGTGDVLRELPNNTGANQDTVTLLDLNSIDTNVLNQPEISVIRQHMVMDSGLQLFSYYVEPQVFRDSCLPVDMCLECTYNLRLSVKDYNGNEMIPGGVIDTTIGTYPFNVDCLDSTEVSRSFSMPLDVGVYTITKVLTVNTDIIDDYIEAYIDSASCLISYDTFLQQALDTIDFSGCGNSLESYACIDSLGTLQEYISNGGTKSEYDSLFAECIGYELAYSDPCEVGYKRMLQDFTPGGQYAGYMDSLMSVNPAVYPLSVLNDTNHLPDGNAHWRTPHSAYRDENGNLDSILYNGIKYPPGHDSISLGLFINSFKPSWAESLVEYHPEYCYYDWCLLNAESHQWDQEFDGTYSFKSAWNEGYLNAVNSGVLEGKPDTVPTNLSAIDPFFDSGGQGYAYVDTMQQMMEEFIELGAQQYTIWEASMIRAYCPGVNSSGEADSCLSSLGNFGEDTCHYDVVWSVFKPSYKALKEYLYDSLALDYAIQNGCYNGCIGAGVGSGAYVGWETIARDCYGTTTTDCPGYDGTGIKGFNVSLTDSQPCNDTTYAYYATKSNVWGSYSMANNSLGGAWSNTLNYDTIGEYYCEGYADSWFMALQFCDISTNDSIDLRNHMINICKLGSDINNPYGASSIDPDTFYLVDTFNIDSIKQLFDLPDYESLLNDSCSPWLIASPMPYNSFNETFPNVDSCGCDLILQNEYSWDTLSVLPSGVTNKVEYFHYVNDFYPGNYNSLVCSCNEAYESSGSGWTPTANWNAAATSHLDSLNISAAPGLSCTDKCVSCDDISDYAIEFDQASGLPFNDSTHFHQMFSNWLNANTSYHFQPLQLKNFMAHCDSVLLTVGDTVSLCDVGFNFPTPDSLDDCEEFLVMQATFAAQQAHQVYMDSVESVLHALYLSKCESAIETEQFDMIGKGSAYQITLYYYDQSGLLVKTVPPAGVDKLNNSEVQNVPDARALGNHYRPDHTLISKYRYNSLNGLVSQDSPDGGQTQYWYDHVGRLVLSQNEKQEADTMYSYTFYDRHGRIIEVGQVFNPDTSNKDIDSLINNQSTFEQWIEGSGREQLTRTFYDDPIHNTLNSIFGAQGQEHLRLRVASTAYYDTAACDTCYRYASHFSYDVHGNVKEMVQDIKALGLVGQRFKHIEYEYDLISGNVIEVNYQPSDIDGFHHRYHYDEDNRLVETETSPQKEIWSSDAKYQYYDHGPLARVERGEYNVQGEDIVYTINGWIKAVNSNTLDSTRDQGRDATEGYLSYNDSIHRLFGADEFSYSLGYFNGDYSAIGGAGANTWLASISGSGVLDQSSNLFNGNIGHMITNWGVQPVQAMAYTYDQLNRLVEANAFQNLNAGSNAWSASGMLGDYQTSIVYDPNGNIDSLQRNGYGGTLGMDDLDYTYIPNTNQLEYVDDQVSAGNYAVDIDDQASGNYTYNEIGQLNSDASENALYGWNVYGKIAKLDRSGSGNEDAAAFGYDPQGNRVYKATVPRTAGVLASQDNWEESWYIRDVRGNIMAVYGSSYSSSGVQGVQSCGYVILSSSTPDGISGGVHLTIDGNDVTSPVVVPWNSSAAQTACDLADSINTYTTSSSYTAYCSDDTVHICADSFGIAPNGNIISTGGSHDPKILIDSVDFSGGVDHTLEYQMVFEHDEHHIYGSSRLGVIKHVDEIASRDFTATTQTTGNIAIQYDGQFDDVVPANHVSNSVPPPVVITQGTIGGTIDGYRLNEINGLKTYEYTNHLGNVLLTTSDKRIPIDNDADNLIEAYSPDILSYSDYYPYGMPMVGRNTNLSDYRFGMNGMEMDNEVSGNGNSLDFGSRHYNPRLGRWFSVDPKAKNYPHMSPYASFENNPIYFQDPDGEDAVVTIKGNTVTIKAKIYIYGSGASKAQAAQMQKSIMNDWDKGWTYTDQKTGQTYNIKFDVSVEVYDEQNPTDDPFILDKYNPWSRDNYVEVGATPKDVKRSHVDGGDEGVWRGYGSDPAPHEFGHLIGLDDQYIEGQGAKPGWQGNIMAEAAGKGVVQQKNIDALLTPIITELFNAGSPKTFNTEINIDSPNLEPEAIKGGGEFTNIKHTTTTGLKDGSSVTTTNYNGSSSGYSAGSSAKGASTSKVGG